MVKYFGFGSFAVQISKKQAAVALWVSHDLPQDVFLDIGETAVEYFLDSLIGDVELFPGEKGFVAQTEGEVIEENQIIALGAL